MPPIRSLRHSHSIIRAAKSCSASPPQATRSCRSSRVDAEHPGANAKLLIGDERMSSNPKLNNVLKGWRAAAHDWIIIADSNVLMPPDYIQRLFANWRRIPVLSLRLLLAAARTASGPKSNARSSIPIRRAGSMSPTLSASASPRARPCCGGATDLERAGGIAALANEVAEDAAATKIVRGRRTQSAAGRPAVRAAARPAQRRARSGTGNSAGRVCAAPAFFAYFLPEILSGGVLPMIAVAIIGRRPRAAADAKRRSLWRCSGTAARCCLPPPPDGMFPRLQPLYGLVRDLLVPFSSSARCAATASSGAATKCRWSGCGRVLQIARMRPHLQEIARATAGGGCAPFARERCQQLTRGLSLPAPHARRSLRPRRDRPENPPRSRPLSRRAWRRQAPDPRHAAAR